MDPTMRQIVKDVTRLRKAARITQQDVSALAGEPCRTFLAHLEQGRKTHINLKKLYGVLHVFFSKTKGIKMSGTPVTKEEVLHLFADFKQEILALVATAIAGIPTKRTPKKSKVKIGPIIDDLIRKGSVANPVSIQMILEHFFNRLQAGEEFYGKTKHITVVKQDNGLFSGSAIENYIQSNSKVFDLDNKPENHPNIKFIRVRAGFYAPNLAHWPEIKKVENTLTVVASNPSPAKKIKHACLEGVTQEHTDEVMGLDYLHANGPRKDSGWIYVAHQFMLEQLRTHGKTTKETIHNSTINIITEMKVSAPSWQSHQHVTNYLLWLCDKGYVTLEMQGKDLLVLPGTLPGSMVKAAP